MRIIVATVLLALAVPATSTADPKSKRVDITKAAGEIAVFKSARGHYIAIAPKKDKHFYYGTKRAMYRQWNRGSGGDAKKGYAYFWEPRLGNGFYASGNRYRHRTGKLDISNGIANLECGKRKTAFALLDADKAKAFLGRAKFFEPKHKREPYALARDARGKYYYVDRLTRDFGGKGFRVYVGFRGRMKKTRLVNVAIDSAGAVFATKRGDLRMTTTTPGERGETSWVRKRRTTKLIPLALGLNRYLIYTELGMYDGVRLGTPCDDY